MPVHRVGGAGAVQSGVGNALHRWDRLAGTARAFSTPLSGCTGRREAGLILASSSWDYSASGRIRPRWASGGPWIPVQNGGITAGTMAGMSTISHLT